MLLAKCSSCGHIFQTSIFSPGPSPMRNTTIMDVTLPCEKCGRAAKMMPGVFDIEKAYVKVVSASNSTRDEYKKFFDVIRRTRSGTISTKEAVDEIVEIAPEFQRYLETMPIAATAIKNNRYSLIIAILIFILLGIKVNINVNVNLDIDVNKAIEQLTEALSDRNEPSSEILIDDVLKGLNRDVFIDLDNRFVLEERNLNSAIRKYRPKFAFSGYPILMRGVSFEAIERWFMYY